MVYIDLNPARWNLDEVTKQKRSRVFWQLFTQDTWLVSFRCLNERRVNGLIVYVYQSFSFGRPPSLIPSFIDCGFPRDLDEYTNKDGGKEMGCKFRISSPISSCHQIYLPPISPHLDMAIHQITSQRHDFRIRCEDATISSGPRPRPQNP